MASEIHHHHRANSAAPATPGDWRERIARLLTVPGIEPPDMQEMRAWLAWGKLPARYWQRASGIAERAGCNDFADDLGT